MAKDRHADDEQGIGGAGAQVVQRRILVRLGFGHAEIDDELDEARIAFTTALRDIFAQATNALGHDIGAQARMIVMVR